MAPHTHCSIQMHLFARIIICSIEPHVKPKKYWFFKLFYHQLMILSKKNRAFLQLKLKPLRPKILSIISCISNMKCLIISNLQSINLCTFFHNNVLTLVLRLPRICGNRIRTSIKIFIIKLFATSEISRIWPTKASN